MPNLTEDSMSGQAGLDHRIRTHSKT